MDLKNLLLVTALAVVAILIGLFIPKDIPTEQVMPWQIEKTASGTTRVFGIALGESDLTDVERNFKAEAEVSLFAKPDGELVAEVFFEKLELGGLSAKAVVVTALTQEELQQMFDRGTRISTLGSGTNKVTLAVEDLERLRHATVESITYLPRVKLKPEVVEARFGKPAEIIAEPENDVTHWLYPELGLDITLTPDGKVVMQYIAPARFEKLVQPLRKALEEVDQQEE